MIHTANFYCIITTTEYEYVKKKYSTAGRKLFDLTKLVQSSGINRTIIKKNENYYRIWLDVDVTEMLNKGNIEIKDIDLIESNLKKHIKKIIGGEPKGLILERVDFKFDAIVTNVIERKILIKLFNKCLKKASYLTKTNVVSGKIKWRNFGKQKGRIISSMV